MTLTVITPPAEPAISRDAAKEFLRIGTTAEDGLVDDLVSSAAARIETAASLALVSRTLELRLSQWPAALNGRGLILRPAPVVTLVAVELVDEEDAVEDVSARFVLDGGRLCLRSWSFAPPVPVGGHIIIRFTAGFGAAADVPPDLQLAVKMLVADSYAAGRVAPQIATQLPTGVADILDARREVRL